MQLMALLVLWLTAGCARVLPLDGRACPCTTGYVCDTARDRCVRQVESPSDAAAADAQPSPSLTRQLVSPDRGASVWRLWASGANNLYAAGTGVFRSSGDGNWTEITPAEAALTYGPIWGNEEGDLYLFAEQTFHDASALLHRSNIGAWTWIAAPATIAAIWGSAADDVWAVGESGTILHSTGRDWWEPVASPTTSTLRSVWGTSHTNAYAVGDGGTIVRWDGKMWSLEVSGIDNGLGTVGGRGPNEIYALRYDDYGPGSMILRSTGDGQWTPSPGPMVPGALWRSNDGGLYIVGCSQLLQLANDGTWVPVDDHIDYPCATGAWGTDLDHLYLVAQEPYVFYRS